MFNGEAVWFQGHRVPSDAGGDADGCIFPGCAVEVWAFCPFCRECLCGHHLDSPCPHSSQVRRDLWMTVIEDGMPSGPRSVSPCTPAARPTRSPSSPSAAIVGMPRRRLRRKTAPLDTPQCSIVALATPPVKSGGWRKCLHPLCADGGKTLRFLTGRKDGHAHEQDRTLRVCQNCRRKPLPSSTTTCVDVSPPSTPSVKHVKVVPSGHITDLAGWNNDTPEKLIEEYKHTPDAPAKYSLERWQLKCRIAALLERGVLRDSVQAQHCLSMLKVPRRKIRRVQQLWRVTKDKVAFVNHMPSEFRVGKGAGGGLTVKQRCDLAQWCRVRENIAVPLHKNEVQCATSKFLLLNKGIILPADVKADAATWSSEYGDQKEHWAQVSETYYYWRQWTQKNIEDSSLHMSSKRKAACLRQVEAEALTRERVHREFQVLAGRVQRRGLAETDSYGNLVIKDAARFWCADEKGFNDESMQGQRVLATAENKNVHVRHGRHLKHISVLTFISASGERAPPAVVMSGSLWHPDWQALWPESKCAATPKGSFNSELFVQMTAETFVHHVRVVRRLEGRVAADGRGLAPRTPAAGF